MRDGAKSGAGEPGRLFADATADVRTLASYGSPEWYRSQLYIRNEQSEVTPKVVLLTG